MNITVKNAVLWVIVGAAFAFFLFANGEGRSRAGIPMDYSDFLGDVKAGRVEKVFIDGPALRSTSPTETPATPTPRRRTTVRWSKISWTTTFRLKRVLPSTRAC